MCCLNVGNSQVRLSEMDTFAAIVCVNAAELMPMDVKIGIVRHKCTDLLSRFHPFKVEITVSGLQSVIEEAYKQAKKGQWERVLAEWKAFPRIAYRCSRYQKESSGWTFLHQAAYFGQELACRELIRLGAAVNRLSREGKTSADVAEEKGHTALAALLRRAYKHEGSQWVAPADPDLRPSSGCWEEANECRATEAMLVAYAGGVVKIPAGRRYFADSFERVLIGWHGSYDPPCGMDGEPMVRVR